MIDFRSSMISLNPVGRVQRSGVRIWVHIYRMRMHSHKFVGMKFTCQELRDTKSIDKYLVGRGYNSALSPKP